MIAKLWAYLPRFLYGCYNMDIFCTFWARLLHCGYFGQIWGTNVTVWACLPHFGHDFHTLGVFATFCHTVAYFPNFGHDCYNMGYGRIWDILGMIATLWLCWPYLGINIIMWTCLPHFGLDFNTVGIFATFWA